MCLFLYTREGRERKKNPLPFICLVLIYCWIRNNKAINNKQSKEPVFQAFRWVFLIFKHEVLCTRKSNRWRERNIETLMEAAAQTLRKMWVSTMGVVGSATLQPQVQNWARNYERFSKGLNTIERKSCGDSNLAKAQIEHLKPLKTLPQDREFNRRCILQPIYVWRPVLRRSRREMK